MIRKAAISRKNKSVMSPVSGAVQKTSCGDVGCGSGFAVVAIGGGGESHGFAVAVTLQCHPDDGREGVDDGEAAARGSGDQQATVVGAQVEGGERRPVARPRWAIAMPPQGARGAPKRIGRLRHQLDPTRQPHGAALRGDCNKAKPGSVAP